MKYHPEIRKFFEQRAGSFKEMLDYLRSMCRTCIQKLNPVLHLLISFVFTIAIFYFEESHYSFDFLTSSERWNVLFFTILLSVPSLLMYAILETSRFKSKAFLISLSGFVFPVTLLGRILF